MRSLFGELREHISGKGVRIVFPEGNDDRVVRAAARSFSSARSSSFNRVSSSSFFPLDLVPANGKV